MRSGSRLRAGSVHRAMRIRRCQGMDRLRDRQQRDRIQAPRRFRRNSDGLSRNRKRHEQQVQGNKRGGPRPLRNALLIEWAPRWNSAWGLFYEEPPLFARDGSPSHRKTSVAWRFV